MVVWVEQQVVQSLRLTPLLSFPLLSSQLSSISKAINSSETPVKEKHARRILKKTINPISKLTSVVFLFCAVLPLYHGL